MEFYAETTLFPAEVVMELAAAAEASGWAGLSLADHVVHPMQSVTKYPYTPDGESYLVPELEWQDPFVMVAAAAARTTTLKFITGIYILPMRNPVLVAKGLSTLESTAPGRVIFGVGAGWWREEFEAIGAPFAKRGRRMDEAIEVVRKLLTGGPVSHQGTYFRFPEVAMSPSPSTPIPIWIGGTTGPALDRAARLGDGLIPVTSGIEHVRELVAEMDRRRETLGRDHLPFEITGYANDCRTVEDIQAFADAGVRTMRVNPYRYYVDMDYGDMGGQAVMSTEQLKEALERYAEEFVRPLADA